jgi:uncharacterized protein (DUF58 family)
VANPASSTSRFSCRIDLPRGAVTGDAALVYSARVQPHPTRNAVDLTIAGIAVLVLGLALGQPAILAWGGALFLGLQLARSVTLLGVTRIRASGFEMLWRDERRLARIGRGETLTLKAEVRNRDARAVRYVQLRSIHSPHLSVILEPASGEVPAGGRLAVTASIQATRVGRHGIFGLSLEVQGAPGLYEVPLTFANPFGIEVVPHVYATRVRLALGGRSRTRSEAGRPGRRPLGSYDLREIRGYQAGDAFKRIAWKASARRGQLMVREFDEEERDIVWLVLDASVELWAGATGKAPLDTAIEQVASIAEHHLRHGDKVGLAIIARETLAWIPPGSGPLHTVRMLEALSFKTDCKDAARSTLDEAECATRVLEHLRPLDPTLATGLHSGDVVRIANRGSRALARAPFDVAAPNGPNPNDQALRHYMAAFGLDSPARLEPDRPHTDAQLLRVLGDMTRARPRPTLITICSPFPDIELQRPLIDGLASRRRLGIELRWLPIPLSIAQELPSPTARAVSARYALELRAESVATSGRRQLRRLAIHIEAIPVLQRRPPMRAPLDNPAPLVSPETPTRP